MSPYLASAPLSLVSVYPLVFLPYSRYFSDAIIIDLLPLVNCALCLCTSFPLFLLSPWKGSISSPTKAKFCTCALDSLLSYVFETLVNIPSPSWILDFCPPSTCFNAVDKYAEDSWTIIFIAGYSLVYSICLLVLNFHVFQNPLQMASFPDPSLNGPYQDKLYRIVVSPYIICRLSMNNTPWPWFLCPSKLGMFSDVSQALLLDYFLHLPAVG